MQIPYMVKSLFTKTETQQTRECCWVYLPGPPQPRWGWSQGRTPVVTTAVRSCFHDAKEWLVSWIRTVLSDSAGGDSATPGRRNAGRMWNVTEQGHSKGHCETRHPPSTPSHWGIYSPASCCIWRISCLNLSFVWSLTRALSASAWSSGESADNNVLVWKGKTCKPKQQGHLSVSGCFCYCLVPVNSREALNCNWSFWLLRNQGINL